MIVASARTGVATTATEIYIACAVAFAGLNTGVTAAATEINSCATTLIVTTAGARQTATAAQIRTYRGIDTTTAAITAIGSTRIIVIAVRVDRATGIAGLD